MGWVLYAIQDLTQLLFPLRILAVFLQPRRERSHVYCAVRAKSLRIIQLKFRVEMEILLHHHLQAALAQSVYPCQNMGHVEDTNHISVQFKVLLPSYVICIYIFLLLPFSF
jgi:hypothetical protein